MSRPRAAMHQRRASPPPPLPKRFRPDWDQVTQTSTIPGIAILPLRAFLGVTFVYAGLQKLTDPGFLRLGSSTYIGSQLRGFSQGSPIHFLLIHFLEHAQAIGVLTILTEIAIGVLVLAGLFTRLAALGGLGLNLIFFLSASWHVYPYFLGSDIVFVMCWLTLTITGPGGWALDNALQGVVRAHLSGDLWRAVLVPVQFPPRQVGWEAHRDEPGDGRPRALLSRGEALAAGVAAVVLIVLGLAPKGKSGPSGAVAGASRSAAPRPASRSKGSSGPPGTRKIGNLSEIPVNGSLPFTDPRSGDPAVVVRTTQSNIYCYDAVCTHAGCTVEYDPGYKLLVCPCHGGAYDPAHAAQVVAGPPPSPLPQLPISITPNGDIYVA